MLPAVCLSRSHGLFKQDGPCWSGIITAAAAAAKSRHGCSASNGLAAAAQQWSAEAAAALESARLQPKHARPAWFEAKATAAAADAWRVHEYGSARGLC